MEAKQEWHRSKANRNAIRRQRYLRLASAAAVGAIGFALFNITNAQSDPTKLYLNATFQEVTDGTGQGTSSQTFINAQNGFAVGDNTQTDGVVASSDIVTYQINLQFQAGPARDIALKVDTTDYLAVSSNGMSQLCQNGKFFTAQLNTATETCTFHIPAGAVESITAPLMIEAQDTGGTVQYDQSVELDFNNGAAMAYVSAGNPLITVVSAPAADIFVTANVSYPNEPKNPSSFQLTWTQSPVTGYFDLTPVMLNYPGWSTKGASIIGAWSGTFNVASFPTAVADAQGNMAQTTWTETCTDPATGIATTSSVTVDANGNIAIPGCTGVVTINYDLPNGWPTADPATPGAVCPDPSPQDLGSNDVLPGCWSDGETEDYPVYVTVDSNSFTAPDGTLNNGTGLEPGNGQPASYSTSNLDAQGNPAGNGSGTGSQKGVPYPNNDYSTLRVTRHLQPPECPGCVLPIVGKTIQGPLNQDQTIWDPSNIYLSYGSAIGTRTCNQTNSYCGVAPETELTDVITLGSADSDSVTTTFMILADTWNASEQYLRDIPTLTATTNGAAIADGYANLQCTIQYATTQMSATDISNIDSAGWVLADEMPADELQSVQSVRAICSPIGANYYGTDDATAEPEVDTDGTDAGTDQGASTDEAENPSCPADPDDDTNAPENSAAEEGTLDPTASVTSSTEPGELDESKDEPDEVDNAVASAGDADESQGDVSGLDEVEDLGEVEVPEVEIDEVEVESDADEDFNGSADNSETDAAGNTSESAILLGATYKLGGSAAIKSASFASFALYDIADSSADAVSDDADDPCTNAATDTTTNASGDSDASDADTDDSTGITIVPGFLPNTYYQLNIPLTVNTAGGLAAYAASLGMDSPDTYYEARGIADKAVGVIGGIQNDNYSLIGPATSNASSGTIVRLPQPALGTIAHTSTVSSADTLPDKCVMAGDPISFEVDPGAGDLTSTSNGILHPTVTVELGPCLIYPQLSATSAQYWQLISETPGGTCGVLDAAGTTLVFAPKTADGSMQLNWTMPADTLGSGSFPPITYTAEASLLSPSRILNSTATLTYNTALDPISDPVSALTSQCVDSISGMAAQMYTDVDNVQSTVQALNAAGDIQPVETGDTLPYNWEMYCSWPTETVGDTVIILPFEGDGAVYAAETGDSAITSDNGDDSSTDSDDSTSSDDATNTSTTQLLDPDGYTAAGGATQSSITAGSSYTVSLSFDEENTSDGTLLFYTTAQITTPTVDAIDPATGLPAVWIPLAGTALPDGVVPTAIMVQTPPCTTAGVTGASLDITLNPTGNSGGDNYVMWPGPTTDPAGNIINGAPFPANIDVVSATISGIVWWDTNGNGSPDDSNADIQGACLNLYQVVENSVEQGSQAPTAETTTNLVATTTVQNLAAGSQYDVLSSGDYLVTDGAYYYEFPELHSGTYYVKVDETGTTCVNSDGTSGTQIPSSTTSYYNQVLPVTTTYSYPNRFQASSSNTSGNIALAIGATQTEVNFGYYKQNPMVTLDKSNAYGSSGPDVNFNPDTDCANGFCTVEWDVTVTNTGNTTIPDWTVNDVLPNNASLVSVALDGESFLSPTMTSDDGANTTYTYNLPSCQASNAGPGVPDIVLGDGFGFGWIRGEAYAWGINSSLGLNAITPIRWPALDGFDAINMQYYYTFVGETGFIIDLAQPTNVWVFGDDSLSQMLIPYNGVIPALSPALPAFGANMVQGKLAGTWQTTPMSSAMDGKTIVALAASTEGVSDINGNPIIPGQYYAWGDNTFGQYANGESGNPYGSPQPVPMDYLNELTAGISNQSLNKLASSGGRTYFIKPYGSGVYYGWGDNTGGQLGPDSPTFGVQTSPVPLYVDLTTLYYATGDIAWGTIYNQPGTLVTATINGTGLGAYYWGNFFDLSNTYGYGPTPLSPGSSTGLESGMLELVAVTNQFPATGVPTTWNSQSDNTLVTIFNGSSNMAGVHSTGDNTLGQWGISGFDVFAAEMSALNPAGRNLPSYGIAGLLNQAAWTGGTTLGKLNWPGLYGNMKYFYKYGPQGYVTMTNDATQYWGWGPNMGTWGSGFTLGQSGPVLFTWWDVFSADCSHVLTFTAEIPQPLGADAPSVVDVNQAWVTSSITPFSGLSTSNGQDSPDLPVTPDVDNVNPLGVPGNTTCNTDADAAGQAPEDSCDQVPVIIPPYGLDPGSLSGTAFYDANDDGLFAFYDENSNGVFDTGDIPLGDEVPLSGVIVILETANGTQIATATTDANGYYEFDNLAPGTALYQVQFGVDNSAISPAAPNGMVYGFTITDPQGTGTEYTGSKADPNSGLTPLYDVTEDAMTPNVNVGLRATNAAISVTKNSPAYPNNSTVSIDPAANVTNVPVVVTATNTGIEPISNLSFSDTTNSGPAVTGWVCAVSNDVEPLGDSNVAFDESTPLGSDSILGIGDTITCTGTIPTMVSGDIHNNTATITGSGQISGETVQGSGTYQLTVAATIQITITKIADNGIPLTGATFMVNPDLAGAPDNSTAIRLSRAGVSANSWNANVAPGLYWLTEVKAPAGYNLLPAPVQFSVAVDGSVTVVGTLSTDGTLAAAGTTGSILGTLAANGSVATDDSGLVSATGATITVVNVLRNGGFQLPFTGRDVALWPYAIGALILLTGLAAPLTRPRRVNH